jgi:hypothetical protein
MATRRKRENYAFAGLAVLALIGGGHAVWDVLFTSPPKGPTEDSIIAVDGHAQLVGSFAEEFVQAYLATASGQQQQLARYVTLPQVQLPNVGRSTVDPVVAYARRMQVDGGVEVWAVTVSVRFEQSEAVGGSASAGAQHRYYRVPVALTDGRLRALALPAEVAPPDQGLDVATSYSATCAPDSTVGTVISGFLGAYLAGVGDLSRYTTADSGIGVLSPVRYNSAAAVSISSDDSSCGDGSGGSMRVLATVTPHSGTVGTSPLSYPLTLVRTSGQWQVSSVDPLPALRDPMTIDQPQSSATPTTSATAPPSQAAAGAVPPATHN